MREGPNPDIASMPGIDSASTQPSTRRLIAFRVAAGLTGALFLFLAISNALAPWTGTAANPDDTQPELHRWFTAVSGATDFVGAACLLALALRPRGRELLAFNVVVGVGIAAIVVTPFSPAFVVLLVVFVPVLVTYPYRSALAPNLILRPRPPRGRLAVAVVAALLLLITAGVALNKQIGGVDSAAQVNSWADYAEHTIGLAAVSLLATTRKAGWQVLNALCAIVWLYLGLVAIFVLPNQQGSWGPVGGLTALAIGAFYALNHRVHQASVQTAFDTDLREDKDEWPSAGG